MAVKHLPPGQDFSGSHFDKGFGFSGSRDAGPRRRAPLPPPRRAGPPTPMGGDQAMPMPEMGEAGGTPAPALAAGGQPMLHPHGHHVVDVEHMNGSVIHHHAHGGYTMHAADGTVSHHAADGTDAEAGAGGIEAHHEPTELAHGGRMRYAQGGHNEASEGADDEAADKRLIEKGVRQHEDHEHGGEHTQLKLARGGGLGAALHARQQRRPPPAPRGPMTGSPVNTAPRDPARTTSPRGAMPGGDLGYGTEPSAEPDAAGTTQGISQLRRGGRVLKP